MAIPADYSAKLIIWEADRMTSRELAVVAEWLREQAKAIIKDGGIYATVFTAKCMQKPRRTRKAG